MSGLAHSAEAQDAAQFAAYPGPALRLQHDLSIIDANALGRELLSRCQDAVSVAAGRALTLGTAEVARCKMPDGTVQRDIELTVIPSGVDILILGRDNSLERRMQSALVESRKRYQDLVAISGDFAWETDASGAFVFVSPKGALGFTAAQLIGRRPSDLLAHDSVAEAVACFSCKTPVHDATVWLQDAAGRSVCVSTSAVPVTSEEAGWLGARGICRDVTDDTARSAELADTRLREQIAAFIGGRIRDEIHPQEMLDAAVSALGRALGATAAIFTTQDSRLSRAAAAGSLPDGIDAIVMGALGSEQASQGRIGESEVLARATSYRGEANGALVLARTQTGLPWDDNDRQLLEATARQLGVALRQIQDQRELYRLSNTDGLTGLLNRRAFNAALKEAIATCRNQDGGALMYVDLDNFKPINDELGHAQGDATLRAVAAALTKLAADTGFAARVGGDEFAVWYAQADAATAERCATAILTEISNLGREQPEASAPLGASVGIAILSPKDDPDGTSLVSRADSAMYEAKRGGKGRYAIAPGPQAGSP